MSSLQPQIPPQTELEFLRRRNVELSLQVEYYQVAIRKLIRECRDWQQVAIAAEAKAQKLEKS